MNTLNVDDIIYNLPENEADVMSLVNQARATNSIICMRGAAHSFPAIKTFQSAPSSKNRIFVMLSNMREVTYNEPLMQVTVQAGCNLGLDPFDPSGISTLQNSLLWQIDQLGWAIPDLGGITHQTVGGFVSTGSSGGSTQFSFDEQLVSLTIVTCGANGAEVVTFNKPNPANPDDPFYAAGVAMGLFGVVISATFQCVPHFNIAGSETTSTTDDCMIDLFGSGDNGKPNLETFLQQTQYTRLMWWPQENVTKMVVWQAKQIPVEPGFVAKPYHEVPYILGGPFVSLVGADLLFTAISRWPTWLGNILGTNSLSYRAITDIVDAEFYSLILPKILDIFVKVNDATNPPQQFQDTWWHGIPMDNQMSDKLMPVWFTELWIPIGQSQAVMTDLRDFFNESPQHTSWFSYEIYAAKQSDFWLSPAYQTDVIRIDVFWFANMPGSPADTFYPMFWNLLAKYNYRPHWGKYLPDGSSAQGAAYLQARYPKWQHWMDLRAQYDPHQVFLSDYWRSHLGIPQL
jgi:D-arabinono-1,4-lactone oxidase